MKRADKDQPGDDQLCLRPAPVGRNQLSHVSMEPTGPRVLPFRSRALGTGSSRKYPRDQARSSGRSTRATPQPLAQPLPPKSSPWVGGRKRRQTDGQGRYGESERAHGGCGNGVTSTKEWLLNAL